MQHHHCMTPLVAALAVALLAPATPAVATAANKTPKRSVKRPKRSPKVNKQTTKSWGKRLFLERKCNMCHTVKSHRIAKIKGPLKLTVDLSKVGSRQKRAFFAPWLTHRLKRRGRKHPRLFKGTPDQLNAVVSWLASLR